MSSSEVLGKLPQLAISGPKWCELVPIFPQMPKIANNCQTFIQHDPNWQCLAFMGHVGSFRAILGQFADHLRPFGPFLHTCTEAHVNEQSLKYALGAVHILCNHFLAFFRHLPPM